MQIFNISKKTFLLLVLLLLIAAVPRAIELLNHNYLFGYDQGQHLLDVKKIVVDKHLTLIGTEVGGQGGYFQGPGWYYLLAIPFILTQGDPYGAMVLMFLIGLVTVIAAFLTTRKIFDDKTSFLIALLVAISPALITHSRFIWNPFPIPLLTVFLLFFLYQVLSKKQIFLPFLTFSLGLMTSFETSTAITFLMTLLILSPVLVIKKLVSLRITAFSLFFLVLTQLPIIVFDLKHNFINTKGIFNMIFYPTSFKYPIVQVIDNRWNVFRDNFTSTFQSGTIIWPFLLLTIILGLIIFLKDKKQIFADKIFVSYLFISPIILFLMFIKYTGLMWSWWILGVHIYYIFLLGILFGYLWKKSSLRIFIIAIVAFFMCSYIYTTNDFYKWDFNDFGGVNKIKGKIQALDYIYNDAGKKPFNLLIFSPPIYTYPYDYLLWWYGREKYGYIPGQKKEGLLYLLIENDKTQPWRYKGWLETVIKTGKIIETKQLSPSGFIIQKRYVE